jgi:hypothetical protein
MRHEWQRKLEGMALNMPLPGADLTEKQSRTNNIAAAPPSLDAWVR